ncbi:6-carboxyhexanoate--CoA ligase [Methanobrevibacter olleyae]|uniref:6-carboxyhexanoate--CoA ligase n=1 Tax=Methanobrevibacter olleyae TaxID=294671 RepID=A0A126R1W7_METOL|nr:6-carboxyhexanoate--CoA ligase [Methanobrevibacter olleyae]AMK16038.1 6-carboxyhexanoate--CoA ligase BioW [Methanobrevibacter olleyae]SFL68784.1 6-carboxyhexanoate--CoA ligase [Methanobrevibacter olleyae]
MMYSIKMRCSKGGPHEEGGKHISGAERILREDEVEKELINIYRRAITHERGKPDFINFKIEEIDEEEIIYKKRLNINQHHINSKEEGLSLAKELLKENTVSEESAKKAIQTLLNLEDSIHGAMLFDKDSGERIDNKGIKGVRVTGIASADITKYKESLKKDGREGLHLEEALILASKIASCKGIVAELCWSDDPSYVIGYVGTKDNYERIPILKDEGKAVGGRIFFVDRNQLNYEYTLDDLINYLEKQMVLIE